MERYDYFEAIKGDVLNYINENNIVVTTRGRLRNTYVTIGIC